MQKDLLPLAARVKREKAKKAICHAVAILQKIYIFHSLRSLFTAVLYRVLLSALMGPPFSLLIVSEDCKISVYQFLLVIIVSMHVQIDNKKNNSNKKID